jgi:anti-anti-sigma factor
MELQSEVKDGVQIVRVSGRLDVSTSPKFIAWIQALERLPTVLDMGELEYLSSAGLRALHVVKKALPKLAVANFSGFCKEIYEVSGFTSIVPEHASVDDAVSALN